MILRRASQEFRKLQVLDLTIHHRREGHEVQVCTLEAHYTRGNRT